MKLTNVQARILGALIEKEITTPENYPLSLNALRNACNQSSSREPVMALDEDEVRQGLHVLEDLGLTQSSKDSRVPKYEHRVRDRLQLRRDETAVICLLLLRGPQTPGELKTRSERLFGFEDAGAVLATLQRLAARTEELPEGALAVQLARLPGARDSRWAQLLEGPIDVGAVVAREEPRAKIGLAEEVETLRREIQGLRERLDRLEGIV